MIQTKKLTLSVLAALGIGLAGPGIAGSGYGYDHSGATSGGPASSAAMSNDSHGFSAFEGASPIQGESPAFEATDGVASSGDGAEAPMFGDAAYESSSDQSSYVVVAEPNLLFSDGTWYTHVDGEWYALESGAWYIAAADDAAYQSSDASLETSDAYALDGSQPQSVAAADSDSGWYYVTEVPYDGTLYTVDGIAWYSDTGELIALVPIESTDDSTVVTRTAMVDGSILYTYHFL